LEPRGDDAQVDARLFECDTRLQAAEGLEPVIVALFVEALDAWHQRPEGNLARGEAECGRHDPDDHVRGAIEQHGPSDNAAVATERSLPEPVAEDDPAAGLV